MSCIFIAFTMRFEPGGQTVLAVRLWNMLLRNIWDFKTKLFGTRLRA